MINSLPLLVLRLFIAYEFFEAGLSKFNGENWFDAIQADFPFPFNLLPADLNWTIAMGAELLFPVLLVLGFMTRFSTIGLAILTLVAWAAVHSGLGYNITQNGYKMAVIYLVTMFPLLTQGAGIFSIDFLLQKKCATRKWLKFL